MQSIQLASLDVEGLRTRLRKMSDEELREFGKAARYMVSPTANMGKPPLPAFGLPLTAARKRAAVACPYSLSGTPYTAPLCRIRAALRRTFFANVRAAFRYRSFLV